MSDCISETEYFKLQSTFDNYMEDMFGTSIDRIRELAVAEREGRVVVCEYNQCYKCPQVMKRTIKDEPCASCYARYKKSHSPTSRKETKPDDDQGSD